MGEERGRTGRRTSLFRGGCCGINSVESRRGGEGAERERDREERRIGENRCVCVRVRVTGYEREREREGGMHRDGVGSSWREKDGETKSDSPTSFSLHAPLAPSTTTLTTARQPQESMHPGSLLPAANDPCAPSPSLSLSPYV